MALGYNHHVGASDVTSNHDNQYSNVLTTSIVTMFKLLLSPLSTNETPWLVLSHNKNIRFTQLCQKRAQFELTLRLNHAQKMV